MLEIKHKYTGISLRVAYFLIFLVLLLFPSPFYIVYNSFLDAFVLFLRACILFTPFKQWRARKNRWNGRADPFFTLASSSRGLLLFFVSLAIRGARELKMRLQSLEHILQSSFLLPLTALLFFFFPLFLYYCHYSLLSGLLLGFF